jgi:polyribonucleotide nucleotidyltransferase
MVEAGANEVSDSDMLAGLEFAHSIVKDICNAQIDFISDYKKQFGIPEIKATFNNPDLELFSKVQKFLSYDKMECLYEKGKKEFQEELNNLDKITKEFLILEENLSEEDDLSFV